METAKKSRRSFPVFLREWCYDKRLYFLVFFLPVAIMFAAYAFFKIHPIGDSSVLVLDLNGQYVYYYEQFRDAFHGNGSFIYNWSRNLSGEMFGIFAYYLASPFMIILLLLPRTIMATSILIMQLAKIGTASVTFMFFLKKISKTKPKTISLVIFPTMYALMAYMVVQLMDPMWLDGLIYLPLICWGVQRLVNEGKLIPYIVPLALMFIAHFYIGYMVGIFTFLYFCWYCLSREGRFFPKKFFSRCVAFGVGTLVALMCAAFVLIPVYNSLKLGKFEFTDPDFSLATQFDFLTFITKLFPMSYDTVYPEGMPMIYCGTAVLLLVPLFFLNNKISMKEKTSTGLLTMCLVILMYIKPADMAMHGFQVPNWLPYRYSFAFSFLLVVMAFRAFENLEGITAKNIGGVFFGLMVFLFWCERENYSHFQLFETKVSDTGESTNVIQGIWVSMIALSIYFALIYLMKKYPKSKAVCIVTVGVLCVELFANSADTIDKIDTDVAYSKYSSYEPYMTQTRNAVSMMKDYDQSLFYRMEATFHRTVNDPIGTGYMGISHSSSTMNAPALSMLHKLGYAYGGHYTKYDGTTFMTDALFDIKYLMDKTGNTSFVGSRVKVPEEYKLTTEYTEGDATYKFYNNPNALGLGLVSPKSIEDISLSDTNPFENQNMIFNALAGNTTQYFTRVALVNSEMENVATSKLTDGHTKYYPADSSIAECHVDYVVQMDKGSYLYMYLPTSYERSCNVWIQDEDKYMEGSDPMDYAGQFFVGDNYSILNLGKFTQGQKIRVRVTISNDDNEAFWKEQLFYSFDYDTFSADCAALQQNVLDVTKFEDTYLEGTVTSDSSDKVLFTTIPYENGWTIKVNGKTVTPGKSLDSLITIPLEQGENVITMKFSPSYWKLSIIISIFGLLVLIVIFLFEYKKGKVMKKALAKAHFTAEYADNGAKSDKVLTVGEGSAPIADDTAEEDMQIFRPNDPDNEKMKHINEMMKNILGEDNDSTVDDTADNGDDSAANSDSKQE
ncbi:YfhO family protein [Ruminococcus sp.]|uniref:YfhO family protein n=1 Tax=Ruminococcus sp. TaxID=41978 RepID=UPI0025CCBA7B|nr:YfhO family protein [Ruminococcus sp.]